MGGYFKVWRKIEDSKSWSRGALYRGLMITLLQKANWKQGYFHGQEILPGQLACSGASLASELDLSRYQVMRMLATLEDDGFISRKTFGKVCTLITVVNWQLYQSATEEAAQQPHNERPSSAQVPHTIEEGKKARKEIPPASADAAEELASLSGKEKQEGAGARTGSAHVTNKAPRSAASATGEGPAPEPAYRTATKRVLTGQRLGSTACGPLSATSAGRPRLRTPFWTSKDYPSPLCLLFAGLPNRKRRAGPTLWRGARRRRC